jgi:hypothetical protein
MVTCNGIPVHFFSPRRKDDAERYATDPAYRQSLIQNPGMVGEIISEWWATSNRNGGRDHSGMVGDIERNQQAKYCLAEGPY